MELRSSKHRGAIKKRERKRNKHYHFIPGESEGVNCSVMSNSLCDPRNLYMDISRWSIPKSDYILCSQRWRSSIHSAKIRPGANYGSDHELHIAKFRLKIKERGKTTRPFRCDLTHIPYDYTVEVTNRFKGLDLRECLKNYGRFVKLYRRQ